MDAVYWYWIDDQASYVKEDLAFLSENLEWDRARQPIRQSLAELNQSNAWCFNLILDRSRSSADQVCPISLELYTDCEPHLLSLTGRSYGREAILEAIEQLKAGRSLRLEDVLIEPEQLTSIVLYPNRSLGAQKSNAHPISFRHCTIPIQRFDKNIKLESRPEFWHDIAQPSVDGFWSLESAAIEHGYPLGPPIVIANQRCEGRKFPFPHPKMLGESVIFRNCLFAQCDILIDCWCGLQLHGCRFEGCVFRFGAERSEQRGKRCQIVNARIFRGELSQQLAMTWLQTNLGQDEFTNVVC